jgi:hypothetical protein
MVIVKKLIVVKANTMNRLTCEPKASQVEPNIMLLGHVARRGFDRRVLPVSVATPRTPAAHPFFVLSSGPLTGPAARTAIQPLMAISVRTAQKRGSHVLRKLKMNRNTFCV